MHGSFILLFALTSLHGDNAGFGERQAHIYVEL